MTTEYDVHMQEVANVNIKLKEDPKKLKGEAISRLTTFIHTKYPETRQMNTIGKFIRDTIVYGKGVLSFVSHYSRTTGNLITTVANYKSKDKKHGELTIKVYEGYLHDILEEDLNE